MTCSNIFIHVQLYNLFLRNLLIYITCRHKNYIIYYHVNYYHKSSCELLSYIIMLKNSVNTSDLSILFGLLPCSFSTAPGRCPCSPVGSLLLRWSFRWSWDTWFFQAIFFCFPWEVPTIFFNNDFVEAELQPLKIEQMLKNVLQVILWVEGA